MRSDPNLFAPPHPVIVGHRGAPLRARENTPEAFAAAASDGAAWVELDARRSADGQVVVQHDPETDDGVAVVGRDARTLAGLGVHRLDGVLDALPPGLGVDVELKNLPGQPDYDEDDRLADLVAGILRPRLGQRPLCTSSFNPATVAAVAERLPAVPAGLLFLPAVPVPAAADLAREIGAGLLCPHDACEGLDAATIAHVRGGGLPVLVWTVDELERAQALAQVGVDAICTNDPASLVAGLRPA